MVQIQQGPITEAELSHIRGLFPELEQISDRSLADKVVEIWAETLRESPWERIEDVPKNPETVNLRHDLVAHTRAVTLMGIDIARTISQLHNLPVDMDLVIAGCNLHDVSKLMEYGPSSGGGDKTTFGEYVLHGTYGVHKILAKGLSVELAHLVSVHTMSARLAPKTLEAVIVHYADYVDSDALMLEAGQRLLLMNAR